MKFKCYQNWNELPPSCDVLFSEAGKDSVFFSREWFETLTTHITNQEQKLLLACVLDDGNNDKDKVLAILPLLTNVNREWTSFCHTYSSLYSILCGKNQQQEIINCLCLGLKDLPFDYLTLAPIAEDDNKLKNLQQSMEAAGLSCYRNHKAYNWFHRIPIQEQKQTFANYMADRPSKVRNTIARKQRKLEREHDYQIRLYIDNDVEQALSDYHDIYRVSWKANEQYQALVEGVIQRFLDRAWPRLAIMSIDGKPIAAQLWFVVESKASIFRLVYDETWKQYSPGSILMNYLLEYVIDTDKVKEIDFLSGNDGYKKDWMSERRERFSLVCVKKVETEINESKGLYNRVARLLFK